MGIRKTFFLSMGNSLVQLSKPIGETGFKVGDPDVHSMIPLSDDSQVVVNNKISGPEEGTALHWHGLLQTATPWYDGTPSVQQCPIAPGQSFT